MKSLMTFIAVLTVSSTVFAGSKDLKIMNKLLKAGADSEQFMSKIHVSLENVECAYSNASKVYSCNMTDLSAKQGEGAPLVLAGKQAKSIFTMLEAAGARGDSGMGKAFISAKSVRCVQAVEGVMDGSAAERTVCTIETSAE